MKLSFSFLSWKVRLQANLRREIEVEGAYSLCKDGKHVVYLDYDVSENEMIDREVKNLQRQYGLGTFYIFQSSPGNHHAICLDKVTPEVFEMIISSSNCDPNFKRFNRYNRMASRVLRTSPKAGRDIKYLYSLDRKSEREKSNPHRLLLTKNYGVDIPSDMMFGGGDDLFICRYRTTL